MTNPDDYGNHAEKRQHLRDQLHKVLRLGQNPTRKLSPEAIDYFCELLLPLGEHASMVVNSIVTLNKRGNLNLSQLYSDRLAKDKRMAADTERNGAVADPALYRTKFEQMLEEYQAGVETLTRRKLGGESILFSRLIAPLCSGLLSQGGAATSQVSSSIKLPRGGGRS